MALVERYWEFHQAEPATSWDIDNVPEGAIHPAVDRVELVGGEIVSPESQTVAPYGLQLSFGVTPEAGVAVGKYFVEAEDDTTQTISSGANNVTISVTQNGGTPTGDTF